jgi:hypothetical protein
MALIFLAFVLALISSFLSIVLSIISLALSSRVLKKLGPAPKKGP